MGVPVACFEIISPDAERARRSYTELFGWTVVDIGDPTYTMIDAGLERAERLGGRTVVPPTALPGDLGSFAVFADPDGQLVGLWT